MRNRNLHLLYVAARVADVDLEITAAIIEAMRNCGRVLGTARGLSALPSALSSTRTASAISICKAVVRCFGLPTINYGTIYEIVKCTIWDDLSQNFNIDLAEGIATIGIFSTLVLGGGPVFLASGAVNIALVVPALTRLMLMLASDLILILVRAFKEAMYTCIGQPRFQDVQKAAGQYAPLSHKVDNKIFKLVPKRNVRKSFR